MNTNSTPGSAANTPSDPLDAALAALKDYDYGASRGALMPIDNAIHKAASSAEAARSLEERLLGVLKSTGRDLAKDYIARKLAIIGSAASVSSLGTLIANPKTSHAAVGALELIPGAEAGRELRARLGEVSGLTKVGVITALGRRRDAESVALLAPMLSDRDAAVAHAAADALGFIGNDAAAQALRAALGKAAPEQRERWADACLHCAEQLLAAGKKESGLALYKELSTAVSAKHVKVAVTRAMLMSSQTRRNP